MLQATHLGLQRKVLAELGKPQSLVQPSELYQFCLVSGEKTYVLSCVSVLIFQVWPLVPS